MFVSNFKQMQKAETHFKAQLEELHEVIFRVPEIELDISQIAKSLESDQRLQHTPKSYLHAPLANPSAPNTTGEQFYQSSQTKNIHLLSTTNESLSLIGAGNSAQTKREPISGQMAIESTQQSSCDSQEIE